jgi:8-oxo-dGTP pyrophosphatase MutT (NUDIX family)
MGLFVTARALLVNPKGEILLVRRSSSDPAHPGTWDIPGGRAEEGEDPQVAAVRETFEEVGVQLRTPRLVYAVSAPRPGSTGTWLFFIEHVPAGVELRLSDEHDTTKWISFSDLPKYTDYQILLGMHAFVTEHQLLTAVA